HAVCVADWIKRHLTFLHVVPPLEPIQVRGDLGEPIQVVNPVAREQVLDELHRAVQRSTASATRTLTAAAGDTTKTITDQALSIGADLIVMGTHGRRGFKRLLLGSVTETVLHHAPGPVLNVTPPAA